MHQRKPTKKKYSKKSIVLMISVIVLVLGIVGASLAYFAAHADPKTNEIAMATVSCAVTGDFDQDVAVQNTGSADAYIRAAIVVNWVDEAGNVYGQLPVAGIDYYFGLDLDDGWFDGGDGYYYYSTAVVAGGTTNVLIDTCVQWSSAPAEGYALRVEVLAQAIQSRPADAVEESWGVTVAPDGTIS